MRASVTLLFLIVLQVVTVQAQDAQWRGPERDGKYPDTGLLKEWPKGGPELILKKEGLNAMKKYKQSIDKKPA